MEQTIVTGQEITVQRLTPDGTALDAINQVIESAVLGWDLAERVKRLVLPSYRYTALDVQHLSFAVACDRHDDIVGVASWEEADAVDSAQIGAALLLHGLFVAPRHQGRGIGGLLVDEVVKVAAGNGYDALLVKAQRDAQAFFASQGFQSLPVGDAVRDYAHRLWRPVQQPRRQPHNANPHR
jgi:GNAT superfamily N-acetyltransferase